MPGKKPKKPESATAAEMLAATRAARRRVLALAARLETIERELSASAARGPATPPATRSAVRRAPARTPRRPAAKPAG